MPVGLAMKKEFKKKIAEGSPIRKIEEEFC